MNDSPPAPPEPRAGSVLLVAAPSGAGKSSLVTRLITDDPSLRLSVSCTTRAPRPGEVEGREYEFVSVAEFERLRDAGELLEWARVHGNYYGTPRRPILEATAGGHDVILEIDWQGARQVRKSYPAAIGVFILPPSIEALEHRLHRRGTDSATVIAQRLLAAGGEISHAPEFEYVIINQDFTSALAELAEIVRVGRLRFAAQAARHQRLFQQFGIIT
ncbi:MAG: guanylate kinase [Pigmentiphaga sp.]